MTEFSDRPFAAGSLIGLRAFAVDALGRLRGPSYDQVFTPFENEAECRRPSGGYDSVWSAFPFSVALGARDPFYSFPSRYLIGQQDPEPEELPQAPTSRRRFPWVRRTTAPEGTGAADAAGYARGGFVRPLTPSAPSVEELNAAAAVAEESKRKAEEAEAKFLAEHTLAGLNCGCGFYAYFDGRNDYMSRGYVAALIEGYGVCTVGSAGFRASKARLVALIEPNQKKVAVSLIARNYPDVPIYPTKAAAIAAHPLSTGAAPANPSDDDFWTRSI